MEREKLTNQTELILEKLNQMGISYRQEKHEAVYTLDEMVDIPLKEGEVIAKNLFLRDARGKKHYLLCLPGDKQVNLKEIRTKIGSTALSFASADRLKQYLGLEAGAVTPFGVINDSENNVQVFIDEGLSQASAVGFHPNVNTSTLFLSLADVETFVTAQGNMISTLKL